MARRLVKSKPNAGRPAGNEPEFGLNVWLENSKKMSGHPRHVIVGAVHGRQDDELYSRTKMNELVKRFLSMR